MPAGFSSRHCALGWPPRAATTGTTGTPRAAPTSHRPWWCASTRSRCSPPTTPTTSRASRRSSRPSPTTCPSSRPPSSTPIPPLTEQLELGLRSFELDLFEDPEGGRYGAPAAQALLELDPIDPAMQEPGFKVFHIQEVDYRSTCLTFVACLTELEAWSEDHPDHLPLVIHLEAKDGDDPRSAGPGLRAADPRERGHLRRHRGRDPIRARRRPARHRRRRPGRGRHAPRRDRGDGLARRSTTCAAASCSCSTTTAPSANLPATCTPTPSTG